MEAQPAREPLSGVQAHGSLVQVCDVGVLLVGPSGIGKSECALDLVSRGHRLVADDVVRIERSATGLVGSAPEIIRHSLEVRGIGLLHVPDLYGEQAVIESAPIELVCRLEEWREGVEFERVGLDRERETWLGVSLPRLRLPARPAGSMATLVEAAALDHRLRQRGLRSGAQRIDDRMRQEPAAGSRSEPGASGRREDGT